MAAGFLPRRPQCSQLRVLPLLSALVLVSLANDAWAAVSTDAESRVNGSLDSSALSQNSSRSVSTRLHLPARDLWRKSSVWRLLPPQKEYPQFMNEFTILDRTPVGSVSGGSGTSRRRHRHSAKARVMKSSHYQLKYTLGRKIVFVCVASGYPRPQITWFKDGIEMYNHNFFKVHEWKVGQRMIKSKMEIDPATPMDVGYYECVADNFHSVDIQGFRTEYQASSYTDPSQRG